MSKLFSVIPGKSITLLFLFLALSVFALAQTQPASQSTSASQSANQPTSSEAASSAPVAAEKSTSEPAKAEAKPEGEKPEAEKDEELQFKESASVKKIGSLLGLEPAKAYWVSTILNFLVIAALIVFALKSNLPGLFRERTAAIQKGMEDARRASAESAARLSDIESRLARLDSDIADMRTKAEQDAKAEDERLRAGTEEEKRKIVQTAEQEIAAASNVARRELKQFAADLAVSLAEKKISVNDAADKVLVRDFAMHLDGANAPKGGR